MDSWPSRKAVLFCFFLSFLCCFLVKALRTQLLWRRSAPPSSTRSQEKQATNASLRKSESKRQSPGMTKGDKIITKVPCLLRPSQGRSRWGLLIDKQSSLWKDLSETLRDLGFYHLNKLVRTETEWEGNPDEAGMAGVPASSLVPLHIQPRSSSCPLVLAGNC